MSDDRYLTLASESTGLHREKASKFISYAFPILEEDDFARRCAAITRQHHTCRHICYAWLLGERGDRHRANDAGEPSGTAGRPILRQLQGAHLTFAAVVVVRYFGGTLLGRGGLVQAYGEAARSAITAGTIVQRIIRVPMTVRCGYARVEALKNDVALCEGAILSADYGADCSLRIAVGRSAARAFIERWRSAGAVVEDDQPK